MCLCGICEDLHDTPTCIEIVYSLIYDIESLVSITDLKEEAK